MSAAEYGRVVVLGLGAMGRPLAETLLRADVRTGVFDVRPEVREALVGQGATTAETAAEAARGADACVVMVQNFAQVKAALWGGEAGTGVLDTLAPNAIVLLMSTVAPANARELDAACAERGLRCVDAPVSGGPGASAAGTLSIMVGAPDETLAAARPLLETLGDPARIWQVGKRAGDGQSMKMINQLMAGINIAASCEALALAAKAGLDPQQAYDIVSVSAGGSWMFNNRVPRMLSGEFTPPNSVLDIFVKDLGIVTDAADALGLPLFLAPLARQVFKMGAAAGLGGEDDAGLVRLYEEWAGVAVGVRGDEPTD